MSISVLILFGIMFALVFAFRVARIGALSAFLLAGVVSGPYVLNIFQLNETWALLGDLGILFLWFTLGLGINMRRLWNLRRTIFGFGAAQVLMVAIMLFPILFGLTQWSLLGCAMTALLLAMSSTSQDMQIMAERNILNTTMGRQTFSILLFQDLLAIPLLAMLPVFAGRSFDLGATAIDIAVLSILVLLGVVIVGRFVLNPLMRVVARTKSHEVFLLAVLLNIVVWALVADLVGLPAGLGAFLAGMLLSETIYHHQVDAEISPYALLFLAMFFLSLGMGLNLPVLGQYWYYILAGIIGLVVIKFSAIFMVARVRNVPIRDATMIALILAQGGEFGLLMLQTMKTSGISILTPAHQEILTAVIILSIMLTPILLWGYDYLTRTGRLFSQSMMKNDKITVETPDVIICGFGRVGQIIAQMLATQGVSYIALDMDVDAIMLGRERGYNVSYGDATNDAVLRDMGLAPRKTRAFVIALDNVNTSRRAMAAARSIAPRVKIFARARTLDDSKLLMHDGAITATPETIESSFFLGYGLLDFLGVSNQDMDKMLSNMRNNNYANVDSTISQKN